MNEDRQSGSGGRGDEGGEAHGHGGDYDGVRFSEGGPSGPDLDSPPPASWSPSLPASIIYIALGLGAVILAIIEGSPMGIILLSAAALALLIYGAAQLLRRPRIEVADRELLIRTLTGLRIVPLAQVVEIRALASSRWGRRTYLMRIEYRDEQGRERLDVFTRADLGTDPRDVVDTLTRIGFPG